MSSVTNMFGMFIGAEKFNSDLSKWNVGSAIRMDYMFQLATVFTSDLTGWNVSAVQDMLGMFSFCPEFNGDITQWDVSSVVDMSAMFYGAEKFNGDISDWDVSSARLMTQMFQGALSFDANLSLWDVSNVINTDYMFADAKSFTGTGLDSWDVGDAGSMISMFQNATLFDADLSKWVVLNVTNMAYMFGRTSQFAGKGLQNWELNPYVTITGIFCNASGIQSEYINNSWIEKLDDAFCQS